jgi:hypothetical protein
MEMYEHQNKTKRGMRDQRKKREKKRYLYEHQNKTKRGMRD